MAIPTFLANKFSPLDFSSITSYPNCVPFFCEWDTYLPKFSGNIERRLDHHLTDFNECMEQQGISLEYVQMKLFMYSLQEGARVWYKTLPSGSISSLISFHKYFNHYCKELYPPNALFEECCTPLNDEYIPEVNDPSEDVCESPFQENIHSQQDASPHEKEREEGKTIELQINSQRVQSIDYDCSPSSDEYDSYGQSSEVELPQSQLWEVKKEEEAHQEVNKEAPVHDAYLKHGEQDQGSPLVCDSYYSEEKEMVMEVQKEFFTSQWGESSKQQVFQEELKAKVEELNIFCGCHDQKYIDQHTLCEEDVVAKIPCLFHDPVVEYMNLFLSHHQRSFQEHVLGSLFEFFLWCMLILIFVFQQCKGIWSSTLMLSWLHWRFEHAQLN